ncbi:MAG TPA: hypothetical protein VMT16_05850 [Thermoanaerobaculia bacterium]|nr:hypothetical protein [Thermoanaerobaculia bacterium]
MIEPRPTGHAAYDELRAAAQRSLAGGDFAPALELLDRALAWAREHGDEALAAIAYCNRAAVAIELGDGEACLAPLRRTLMADPTGEAGFLAAYNIARVYDFRKDYKKGLFYARIARDRASSLQRREWIASARHRMGELLLADSACAEAVQEFHQALRLLPAADALRRLTIEINLGYSDLLVGELAGGLRRLYASLRQVRRLGMRHLEMVARLDLCFGHLEIGRYRSAGRHGAIGLRLAEQAGDTDWIKNGLYLLGEAALLDGREETARECFTDLQQRFYPDKPFVAELLLGVDVRKLINLRA